MPVQPFGQADPIYDALRVQSNQATWPDAGGGSGSTGGTGLENKIYLWHSDGSTVDTFDPTEAGLLAALAAAIAGDTVWLPSMAITLTAALTIPADISVIGISEQSKLLIGALSGAAITLSDAASITKLLILQIANDATNLITLQGPASGIAYIEHCTIKCQQSGAGSATAIKDGAGLLYIQNVAMQGTVTNNGTIYDSVLEGNLINLSGSRCEYVTVTTVTGTGIAQSASAILKHCRVHIGTGVTYGIDISDGYAFGCIVTTDGGTTSTGMYVHGANVEIDHCRAGGFVGAKVEQAFIVSNCGFYGATGAPNTGSHGLIHATTGSALITNSTFDCLSANSFGAYITAVGLTLTDCAWSSISGLANIAYGTGDRSPLNHTHTTTPNIILYVAGDISNPPTEEELETLCGTPASVGAGAAFVVRDTSTNRYYLAVSDGAQFVYSPFISSTAGGGGGSTAIELVAAGAHIAPAWCWFADPRAAYYNGKTYFAYVDSDGDIYIRTYTHSTHVVSAPFDLHAALQIDDHVNPSILIRNSDKKLLAAYSQHGGSTIYLRISSNAEDITAWGSEASLDASLGGNIYTYPSLIQLTGEASEPIYVFYRDHHTGFTQHPAEMSYSKSTDGGATWAAETRLANMTYHKMAANGTARIDFAGSNHPQDPDDHGIYHFYMQGGNYYKSDGTQITATLPMATTDMTQVYDGSSVKAWIWDIAIDGTGKPIIVYATFPTEWSDHRYNYARWTGSAWDKHEITAAGGGLYADQPAYSGGVVLDHGDPSIVYLSKVVSGQWEIFKYTTSDGGATWSSTAITTGSSSKQIRPVAIRNHASDLKFLWLAGTYNSYTNWNLAILGSAQ